MKRHAVESAFTFPCHNERLVGVLHQASGAGDIGLVTIVAGGPQYRGGCGRQLVELARRLAAEGVPVLRFDHRGLGDSEGAFLGFRYIGDDIAAAVAELQKRVPGVRRVILWGGCDAASAALIHAHKIPAVVGVIAANPFVSSERTEAQVKKMHYLSRLKQPEFWRKVLGFKYSVRTELPRVWRALMAGNSGDNGSGERGDSRAAPGPSSDYIADMLHGLRSFQGNALFLMSGRSLVSREFDELVAASPEWQMACQRPGCERREVADADQTFSTRSARESMLDAASGWVKNLTLVAP